MKLHGEQRNDNVQAKSDFMLEHVDVLDDSDHHQQKSKLL
jgi:hypothetical protein